MKIRKYIISFLILGMSFGLILVLVTGFVNVVNWTYHFFHIETTNYEEQAYQHAIVSKQSILGAWGKDDIGNAEFSFYKDSLYYPDPNIWCKYKIISDTIFIERDNNWTEKILILKLDEDSLKLKYLEYGEIEIYGKRK